MKTIVNSICAKALVAVALTGAALSASADLLYWTVTEAKGDANSGKEGASISFAYATVSADGTQLNIWDSYGDTGSSRAYAKTGSSRSLDRPYYAGVFNTADVATFLVELWSSDGTRTGWQSYNASSVADYIYAGDNPLSTPLTVNSVVPEPTSGMLLVLGGALLALRRRRRVMA